MPYSTQESADAVILTPRATPAAAVIWLHGLGADGFDFVPIVEELHLPATLPVVGFGVFLMTRQQMLGLRERAEALARARETGQQEVAAETQPVLATG